MVQTYELSESEAELQVPLTGSCFTVFLMCMSLTFEIFQLKKEKKNFFFC